METFLTQFHFLRPEWFWALLPALALYVGLKLTAKMQSGWQSVIPSHLYQHMIVGKLQKQQRPPLWLLAMGWLMATIALAGPTWERLPQPVYQLKLGHVIVMDMSLSMRATDVTPDRLTRAKYKAIDLVNQIGEGEMGLVAYAGDAFVVSPLTQDAANITTLLPSLSPEIMPVPGSDPLLGIQTAAELLTNAGYSKGMIYWITDGINSRQQQELQEYVSASPYTLNALAVGSAEGAPIRQISGELLKDNLGAIVIPKLNTSAVNAVVRASGGRFSEMTPNDDDITALSRVSLLDRDGESQEEENTNQGDQWREFGPYLVLALLPALAFGFRRGLVFVIAMVAMLYLPISTQPAFAQTSPAPLEQPRESSLPWWKKPFLNNNQEGFSSYSDEDFNQAASQFDDPAWQGAAFYKAGDYEQALRAYQQLEGIEGLYNQGNALARLGKLEAAIDKYEQVLSREPAHQDALENKALLEQLKQQQDQQQDDNQNQDNSESNSKDSSSKDDNSASDDRQSSSQDDSSQDEQSDNSQSPDKQQDTQSSDSDTQDSPSEAEQNEQNQRNDNEEQEPTKEEPEPVDAAESENQPSEAPLAAQPQAGEMTDAEKEQQQRLENLMRRVPDDPAFLLKRKMQLEAQQRNRQRMPSNRSDW